MNMSQGLVENWLVEDGETVEEEQALVEIESEKAVSVVDAPEDGVVTRNVEAGENVAVGTVLATITQSESAPAEDRDVDSSTAGREEAAHAVEEASPSSTSHGDGIDSPPAVRATPSARRALREKGVSLEAVAESRATIHVTSDDVEAYASADAGPPPGLSARVPASPAARRVARDRGVDLATVEGSGPAGAVVQRDVDATLARPARPANDVREDATVDSDATPTIRDRQTLTGVREAISTRLSRSWRTAPHVTVDREISVGRVLDVREQLAADPGVDISLDDIFLVATAETLDRHPDFNATLENDEHVRYESTDIAIAVDTDRGLLSPVLPAVSDKGLATLAEDRAELVNRARDGSIDPDQLAGGTFTVTNLGPLGVDSFTPIINPPQVAILGLSAIRRTPREGADGSVDFEDVLTASLSFDHRAVDGADAARFLETFDELLSRPVAMVVD